MHRLARTVISGITAALAIVLVPAGAANAAASTPPSGLAAHGLGAAPPTDQVVRPAGVAHGARVALATLPTAVDLRAWAVTPGYQGSLNSCVPWAIAYAMLGWYSRYSGRVGRPFAPMYTYSQISTRGGGDYGSDPSAVLEITKTQGNATRALYTQGDYNWKRTPSAAQHINAAKYRIAGYTVLFMGAGQAGSVTAVKQAISTKHPVALKIAVRDGFETLDAGRNAVDADTTSPIRGYHEVLAVGYDAAGLIVQNSWGTAWANGGFGRISWPVVENDAWEGETISGFAALPTAPRVTVPRVEAGVSRPSTRTTTKTVAWRATPGNTGPITRINAWLQADGRARVAVKLSSAKATSMTLVLRKGHRYRASVRARAGYQIGKITYGPWFRV